LEDIDGKDEVVVTFEDLVLESQEKARITVPFPYLTSLMPIGEGKSL
jgi:hypothetical protein